MARDCQTEVWRTKDGRAWRIGSGADIAWIHENTEGGLAITSAIPPVFEAYVTVELPGTGDHDAAVWLENPDRHAAGMLAVLSEHTAVLPWWLGYLDTGSAELVFYDVPKVWDDDWTCLGGPRELVHDILVHADLRHRAREVDPSVTDATPPGHSAI